MADNFSAPKPRSLPTPTNVQDVSRTLASWKTQLGPLISNANPPKPPVNFRITNARGGLQLSWSPVDGSQGYEILKSLNGSFTDDLTIIPVNGANNTNFFDNLGGSATTAHYKLRSTTGDPQRGPETGTVSHTSLDANDTSSTPITFADQFTSDHTRANARLGNYGAIRSSGLGVSSGGSINVASAGTTGASSTQPAPLPSATTVPFSSISSGENISAAMVVGQDASITPDPTIPGIISATHIQGNLVSTATPADGNVLAYSATDGQYDLPTNVFVNPGGTGNILPAAGNTTQSLGTTGALWEAALDVVTANQLQVGPSIDPGYLPLTVTPTIASETQANGLLGNATNMFTIPNNFLTFLNPSANSAIELFCINGLAATQTACAFNFSNEICGIHGETDHNGTGTVASQFGVSGECFNLGSGTVTRLVGVSGDGGTFSGSGPVGTAEAIHAVIYAQGSGTITAAYGLHIYSPNTGGGGSVMTNYYALAIDDATLGGAQNPSPMAILVTKGNSQFGGSISFATGSSPSGNQPALYTPDNTSIFYNRQSTNLVALTEVSGSGQVQVGSSGLFGFSTNITTTPPDTGLSRGGSAGIVMVGNGTSGDHSGTIQLTNIYFVNSGFSIVSAGSGVTGSITTNIDSDPIMVNDFAFGTTLCSSGGLGFSTSAVGSRDTGIYRNAAGVVAIGNGTLGNTGGTLLCSTVKFSSALVALGGGTTPTFGTIGGSGPATAAQNTWLQLKDSSGNNFWVPVWK